MITTRANTMSRRIYSTFGNVTGYENIWSDVHDNYTLLPPVLTRETTHNPNFRADIKRRVDATGPYLASYRRVNGARLFCSAKTPFGSSPSGYVFSEFQGVLYSPSPSIVAGFGDTPTRELAVSRLKGKLNDLTGQFKILPPLAESKELVGLIRQAISLTSKAVKALIDIKHGRVRDVLRFAADSWLGYSFGVKPTLQDIHDVGNSIASYIGRQQPITKVKGNARLQTRDSYRNTGIANGYGFELEGNAQTISDLKYKFTAGFDFSVYASNDYTIFDQLGVNVPQLLSAAWELTAFSWAVDYFGTIGAFLDDCFYSPPGSTIYVVENRLYSVKGITNLRFITTNGLTEIYSQSATPFNYEYLEFQRSKLDSLPKQSLRLKTRNEIGLNSLNKLLNLTAVLLK